MVYVLYVGRRHSANCVNSKAESAMRWRIEVSQAQALDPFVCTLIRHPLHRTLCSHICSFDIDRDVL